MIRNLEKWACKAETTHSGFAESNRKPTFDLGLRLIIQIWGDFQLTDSDKNSFQLKSLYGENYVTYIHLVNIFVKSTNELRNIS